jgi:ribosome maturation protein SDO1
MTQTTARIKKAGKHFEVIVDMEKALSFRKGGNSPDFLETDFIFTDAKKGMKASDSDLTEGFGTTELNEIAQRIVREGEILTTQDFRDEEREKKIKQVVDFLVRNATDQNGRPYTPERIKTALEEAKVNIKNVPVENQAKEIVDALSRILPIKIQTKKIKATIPAVHTGKVYGIISEYKENENWLPNGDLETVLEIPAGVLMDFYDKLNSATHGSVLTEEIQ